MVRWGRRPRLPARPRRAERRLARFTRRVEQGLRTGTIQAELGLELLDVARGFGRSRAGDGS